MNSLRSLLLVVSAPSGAGKSTLCTRLLHCFPSLVYSVSCTTRPVRGQEQDGVDYHFLSPEAFAARVARGEFLEHAEVHGNRYGTLLSTVKAAMQGGRSVLMDIDVQGADQIRARLETLPPTDPLRTGFVDVFIAPPSLAVLQQRLEQRGEDTAEVIARRIRNAGYELAAMTRYRYHVVNDDLETACGELCAIVGKELMGHD